LLSIKALLTSCLLLTVLLVAVAAGAWTMTGDGGLDMGALTSAGIVDVRY
jgi:hypothetical protein